MLKFLSEAFGRTIFRGNVLEMVEFRKAWISFLKKMDGPGNTLVTIQVVPSNVLLRKVYNARYIFVLSHDSREETTYPLDSSYSARSSRRCSGTRRFVICFGSKG